MVIKTLSVAAALFVVSLFVFADDKAPTVIKLHDAFGLEVAVTGQSATRIADWIEKMSGGDFVLDVKPPGALAASYESTPLISEGKIDAAYSTPGGDRHLNTALIFVSSVPFGAAPLEYLTWLKQGGGEKLAQEIYARDYNSHMMLCGMIGPETSGVWPEPIESLDQLDGMRIRAFGITVEVLKKFGAQAYSLGAKEIYSSLEIGTIDAAEYGNPSMNESIGLYSLMPYEYFPGWHQPTSTNVMVINMDVWSGLPIEYQTMLEVACNANIVLEATESELQYEAMIESAEKHGIERLTWDDELLDQLEAAWLEVVEEETAKNPDSKKIWDSLSQFRENYSVWGDLVYIK